MDNILSKQINKRVTGKKFVDEDINSYLYASLTQPPIRIISKNGSEDELDFTVQCPNCGKHVNYGKEMHMLNGFLYCDGHCRKKLNEEKNLRKKYGD
jgi:hypothetical protein